MVCVTCRLTWQRYERYCYILLLLPPIRSLWRMESLTWINIFHFFLLEYWVKRCRRQNMSQITLYEKGQEDPPPPSLWQYISETAQTEDFPPGQEAVGTWPGWLRWMRVVGMRQKLPVAALLQFPSLAWQLSITLLPLPVNYPNADWQAACPTPIDKATQWTCSDYITSLPRTGNAAGEHVLHVGTQRW